MVGTYYDRCASIDKDIESFLEGVTPRVEEHGYSLSVRSSNRIGGPGILIHLDPIPGDMQTQSAYDIYETIIGSGYLAYPVWYSESPIHDE